MNKKEIVEKLADVLQVNAVDLNEDFILTADNWDSVAHLGAIAVIDEVCGIVVPTKALQECSSVGEVLKLVEQQMAQ